MKKILTGEVFEEIIGEIKGWLLEGVQEDKRDEVTSLAKQYLIESSFYEKFGTEIDVEEEIRGIIVFYSEYFKGSATAKVDFFRKAYWSKKYKELKEQSFDIANRALEKEEVDVELTQDARILLGKTERLNHALERESLEIQKEYFKDIKEIFINCMFATNHDMMVLGKEIGELWGWQKALNRIRIN